MWQSWISWEDFFCSKNWENGVFSIYWKIRSLIFTECDVYIIKNYIICCVPTQIPYLGKFLFLRYEPEIYSKAIRLQDFLINHLSRTYQWNSHQKWVWPAWLQDSKIGCISRINRWNELVFCMSIQIQEN